jgi:hypothetical protein
MSVWVGEVCPSKRASGFSAPINEPMRYLLPGIYETSLPELWLMGVTHPENWACNDFPYR